MLNVSDEIANDFDLINIVIRDFQSGEKIKPIGP
jgi:hypothetical protein